ncbi:MAG: helix-turn-helix domain-containing protein [Magnetospirillum sp.]|nr:helix-turn-helix domain-containing protein [Magnetospirillum sp.]
MGSHSDPILVPIKETCRLLGIGPTTVFKLIKNKRLEAVKIAPKATRITMRSIRAIAGEVA